MAGDIGSLSRMLLDTATPFDASSFYAEFLSESVEQTKQVINSAGIRGTRSHAYERNRWGNESVAGTIEMEASRALLDMILPAGLGASEATNVFNVAESIPDMYALIDKGADIALVSEFKVGTLTFSGDQSQIVKVSMGIEAESITWGQSWPGSPPTPDTTRPYFFSDLGNITIESTARKIFSFEVAIDNVLIADQFANQLTRDETIQASDRIVTVRLTLPATTANSDLLGPGDIDGETISFVLTNADEASSVLTIALGPVTFNAGQRSTNGKGQQIITLEGQARADGHAGATTPDIRITNAHA